MGVFKIYDPSGKLVGEFKNHYVDVGKSYTLERMFGISGWDTGMTRYIGLGSSLATNGGTPGPASGTTGVNTTGAWQGVSDGDWHLTNEITGSLGSRCECEALRAGNSIYITAKITDVNVPTGNVEINEMGIFLGPTHTLPASNPAESLLTGDCANAMIIRAVRYGEQTGNYTYDPLIKATGVDLYLQYSFIDFEG